MSSGRVGKKKKNKKIEYKPNVVSLQDKLKLAEEEEQGLLKDIDDLKKWIDTIDAMNSEQMKEYLNDRPKELTSVKIQKNKSMQKVQKFPKPKPSTCTGIMASVWKFHKEDDN